MLAAPSSQKVQRRDSPWATTETLSTITWKSSHERPRAWEHEREAYLPHVLGALLGHDAAVLGRAIRRQQLAKPAYHAVSHPGLMRVEKNMNL